MELFFGGFLYMKYFRSYTLSFDFYRSIKCVQLPCHLKDQLRRASSSVCLNLAEGSGKRTRADQNRFFFIALGSAREIQAIFDITSEVFSAVQKDKLDHLCAGIYKLTRWTGY
jgi:four helix bundle protein